MPYQGLSENVEYFIDCLDHLIGNISNILSSSDKNNGGDRNEDIYLNRQTQRKLNSNEFLDENDLITFETQKSYVSPKDVETLTIDYIFTQKLVPKMYVKLPFSDNLKVNASDHLPGVCHIKCKLDNVRKVSGQVSLYLFIYLFT